MFKSRQMGNMTTLQKKSCTDDKPTLGMHGARCIQRWIKRGTRGMLSVQTISSCANFLDFHNFFCTVLRIFAQFCCVFVYFSTFMRIFACVFCANISSLKIVSAIFLAFSNSV